MKSNILVLIIVGIVLIGILGKFSGNLGLFSFFSEPNICELTKQYTNPNISCSEAGGGYGAYISYGHWTELYFVWAGTEKTINAINFPLRERFNQFTADILIRQNDITTWTLLKSSALHPQGANTYEVDFSNAFVLKPNIKYALRIENITGNSTDSIATRISTAISQAPYETHREYYGGSTYGNGYNYNLFKFNYENATIPSCNIPGDLNCDNKMDRTELGSFITKWINNQATRTELGLAIQAWSK